jgi:CD2 antigen cytoplasmic tail-binding protein 2
LFWVCFFFFFKIKKTDEKPEGAEGDKDDSDSDYSNDASPFDRIAVYKQMLELMKPGESVAKSLRRLGELIIS